METRRSEEPTGPVKKGQAKKAYEMIVHGTIEALTGNCGGTNVDGFGGSEPITNVC